MLIGDAIAGSSKACSGNKIGGRIVYLVAHDYYAKAKRMNPELAKTAETKMSNMQKQFPTVDDVFAVGINAGDTYSVDDSGSCPCNGESTVVRVR